MASRITGSGRQSPVAEVAGDAKEKKVLPEVVTRLSSLELSSRPLGEVSAEA